MPSSNIAELQKALEGCDDSDELCEQKAARYNTWIGDIKVFAIHAREKIAETSSQLSALTVARDNVETANAETVLKCDILLQKIDETIFTNIARAHERAAAIHHLEIRNSGLEYIVDALF